MSDPIDRANPLSYRVTLAALRLFCRTYVRSRVTGREHLPPQGVAAIVVTNHSSALDVLLIGHALDRPGHFLAKAEATRAPLLGPFMLSIGAIPTRRDGQDTEALRNTMAILRSGGLIGLAPGGTRTRDGSLGPYDPGFIWLAERTGAVVVPGAVYGARRLMPRGARLPRPGSAWVRFAEPMDVAAVDRQLIAAAQGAAMSKRARLEAVAAHVRDRTAALLADLEAEAGRRPGP